MKGKAKAERIIDICEQLHHKGLLSGCDGNVSCRLDDGTIMITPSAVPKCAINPKDMAIIDLEGKVLQGIPSSEKLMHLEIYRRCEKAKYILHAHPPVAIAWSVARPDLKELPGENLSEVIPSLGCVPFVPYARPASKEMAEHLVPYLPGCRALILSRHGAICWGESLTEVVNGMERIEHVSTVLKYAVQLGGLNPLDSDEIKKLQDLRAKMGDRLY